MFPFPSMMTWALRPHGVRTRGKKTAPSEVPEPASQGQATESPTSPIMIDSTEEEQVGSEMNAAEPSEEVSPTETIASASVEDTAQEVRTAPTPSPATNSAAKATEQRELPEGAQAGGWAGWTVGKSTVRVHSLRRGRRDCWRTHCPSIASLLLPWGKVCGARFGRSHKGAATRVTTIALEVGVNCCPCAHRGIPAILCILEGGSGRRPLLSCFILCDSGLPYGRHLSKGLLGRLRSLGSRHRLCFIGRACCVCLDGISTGIEVDYFVLAVKSKAAKPTADPQEQAPEQGLIDALQSWLHTPPMPAAGPLSIAAARPPTTSAANPQMPGATSEDPGARTSTKEEVTTQEIHQEADDQSGPVDADITHLAEQSNANGTSVPNAISPTHHSSKSPHSRTTHNTASGGASSQPVCKLATRVAPSAPQCAAAPYWGSAERYPLPPSR